MIGCVYSAYLVSFGLEKVGLVKSGVGLVVSSVLGEWVKSVMHKLVRCVLDVLVCGVFGE